MTQEIFTVPLEKLYELQQNIQSLSNRKYEAYQSYKDKYLLGKSHAYGIVADSIEMLIQDIINERIDK